MLSWRFLDSRELCGSMRADPGVCVMYVCMHACMYVCMCVFLDLRALCSSIRVDPDVCV
jgi:hypothetical protein